jgi:hypothetical protein
MADAIATLEKEAEALRSKLEPARQAIQADELQLARLEAALEVLKGNVGLGTAKTVAKPAAGRQSISEDAIVAFVSTNQPVGAAAIGDHIGVKGNSLTVKLGRMIEKGTLTKSGERRQTVYHLA